jgi:hypothetical protein
MPFLLVDATREKLEAALSAANLRVLVEGSPAEVDLFMSKHRSELSDSLSSSWARSRGFRAGGTRTLQTSDRRGQGSSLYLMTIHGG